MPESTYGIVKIVCYQPKNLLIISYLSTFAKRTLLTEIVFYKDYLVLWGVSHISSGVVHAHTGDSI